MIIIHTVAQHHKILVLMILNDPIDYCIHDPLALIELIFHDISNIRSIYKTIKKYFSHVDTEKEAEEEKKKTKEI